MNGSELIHVVALVGARAGIHKREHAGDEQRRAVVGHGERTCKDGTSLAVGFLTVAEEQRVRCRISVLELACLSHEAARQRRATVELRAAGDDEVVAHHIVAYMHRCCLVAVDAAVAQSAGSYDCAAVADADVLNESRVLYLHPVANAAHGRGMLVGVVEGYLPQSRYECRAVTVECHEVCHLCRQLVGHHHLAASSLVEHGHVHAIAEGGTSFHQYGVDVLYVGAVADGVVGDVVVYVVYVAVVANGDVVECGVAQSGILLHASRHVECSCQGAYLHLTGEAYVVHAAGIKAIGGYRHVAPRRGRTSCRRQHLSLVSCQIPVFHRLHLRSVDIKSHYRDISVHAAGAPSCTSRRAALRCSAVPLPR